MTAVDWIGFTGVTILLAAFFLNLIGKLSKDGPAYILLNIIGAGVACLASVMLRYLPFIILEAAWTAVSLFAFISYMRKRA